MLVHTGVHFRSVAAILCCWISWLAASQSGLSQTGTFLDRHAATDLRVVSYNVNFDSIFPDTDTTQAAKFARVLHALEPDILSLQEIYTHSASQVATLLNSIAPVPGGSTWYTYRGGDSVTASRYPLSLKRSNTNPTGDINQAIALVDLPDGAYPSDFYVINNHYKCCGDVGSIEDQRRQRQSDAIVNWLRDARTPGENVDLAPGTPMVVLGDLNLVGGPGPLQTLLSGDIVDEVAYGSDSPPDWDGSLFSDAHPYHNATEIADYTWRSDGSGYAPGRLDYLLYSDSALDVAKKFLLNTVSMSPADLAATGLQTYDITHDNVGANYDHLPLVVDFQLFQFSSSDFDYSRSVDSPDLNVWETSFGLASGAIRSMGDADGDGAIDGSDYLLWQRQFSGPPLDLFAVPEPATIVLLVVVAMGVGLIRDSDLHLGPN
jgi:endonuclease/exonuclease/phosphatase family metal-dependent hydrolase